MRLILQFFFPNSLKIMKFIVNMMKKSPQPEAENVAI